MEVLAFNIVEWWTNLGGPLLQFIVGLGLVVFVHELGHFLAAKWVGIKVERFALGFGPRLLGFQRGDTDYCLKALPLGGYIKMLGQDDFAPLTEDEKPDPRSYNSKSVGARMLVIAAGVVMNVILAAILFIVVGLVGMGFKAPVIGEVSPNYPAALVALAWQPAETGATQPASAPTTQPAFGPGLRAGDRIAEIDGVGVTRFAALEKASLLASGADETFDIAVERTDDGGRKWIGRGRMGVKKDPLGQRFVFGVSPAPDLLFDEPKEITDLPFHKGDRLTAIDGQPVEHYWQLTAMAEKLSGRPVTVTVLRGGVPVNVQYSPKLTTNDETVWLKDGRRGKAIQATVDAKTGSRSIEVALPDGSKQEFKDSELAGGRIVEPLDILGMIPRLEVGAVVKDSRAAEAGIRPDDIIVAYGDHESPTMKQFLEINDKLVGQEAQIVVLRDGKQEAMKVRPMQRKEGAQVGLLQGPDLMHTVVAGIREGSPAQRAGLASGDVVEKVNGEPVATWVDVFNALKKLQGRDVTLTYRRGSQEQTADVGKLDESIFQASDVQVTLLDPVYFRPLMVTIHQTNPVQAVAWGAGETWNFILTTYGSLRALMTRTVSTDTLSGPVGIGRMAVLIGRDQPLIDFIYFLAFISATVAVINFLPLPVVDGGHAVFLIIEKVRGKPLPVSVMNVVQFIGLGLLGLAFILLTWQDIAHWIEGLW